MFPGSGGFPGRSGRCALHEGAADDNLKFPKAAEVFSCAPASEAALARAEIEQARAKSQKSPLNCAAEAQALRP